MKRRALWTFLSITFFALVLFSGCSDGGVTEPKLGFKYPAAADYSTLSWTDAFTAAHAKFSREYAFGDWKGVDWAGLYNRFQPRIAQAQATGDEKAYYLTLHEYLCSIPDGHLNLFADNAAIPMALATEMAGGGFGLAAAELDDWRVIAAAVVPGGPADQAGIVAGAEIVAWGGVPVATAIDRIDVGAVPFKVLTGDVGGESPQATREHHRLEQVRLLTRAPVGTGVSVVFKNPGSAIPQTTQVTAMDDAGHSLSLVNFAKRPNFSDQVDYRILPEGYGYVLVRAEIDFASPDGYPTGVFQRFQEAINSFVTAGVPGIIVDLRGNYGGADRLAADMGGFFSATPSFYEYQEYYDARTDRFLRYTVDEKFPGTFVDSIAITPQTPVFTGPVVALVNPGTISSGEGLPMAIQRLAQGRVIGFHGTNGSFGMVGGAIRLPGGYTIGYPYGRSVDRNWVVQLDSRNGIGGVAPGLRVPMTLENALAFAAGTDVELQYAITYLRR